MLMREEDTYIQALAVQMYGNAARDGTEQPLIHVYAAFAEANLAYKPK